MKLFGPSVFPRRATLARAIFVPSVADAQLTAAWAGEADTAGCLSHAAWCLALIAVWRQRFNGRLPVVWVPAYSCAGALPAARHISATFKFYPVTATLAPDGPAWQTMLEAGSPDVVVVKHYFGCPALVADAGAFCARQGAWLVEDASHVLGPTKGVGEGGDFVIYSPHHHLPILNGALTVIRRDGPARFTAEQVAGFGQPGSWADQLTTQSERRVPVHCRSGFKANLFALLKVIFCVRREGPCIRGDRLPAPALADPDRRLLAGYVRELAATAHQRQRFQFYCDAKYVGSDGSNSPWLPAERPQARAWTPYKAAYRLASGHPNENGLDLVKWPQALPREAVNVAILEASVRWCHSLQNRPVCGRQQAGPKPAGKSLKLVWNAATRAEWDQWVAKAGRSNLLQSWAYGAAKAATTAWDVRRGVFLRDDEPVGFVQALERNVAGLARVTRINRGPLWISPIAVEDHDLAWAMLSPLGRWWCGRCLTVAPELPVDLATIRLMARHRFRETAPWGYESVWVHLDRELDAIRQTMTGKWRRLVKELDRPEKRNISLRVDSDAATFDWMMGRYSELMDARDFFGTPIPLLRELRKQLSTPEHLAVVRATQGGEAVAGILLGFHGAAATYLVGWNSAAGRKAGANQFVFWHAIKHLKQCGLKWFDLGGISEEQTPGITAFKLGLSPTRYELVGEYVKL